MFDLFELGTDEHGNKFVRVGDAQAQVSYNCDPSLLEQQLACDTAQETFSHADEDPMLEHCRSQLDPYKGGKMTHIIVNCEPVPYPNEGLHPDKVNHAQPKRGCFGSTRFPRNILPR